MFYYRLYNNIIIQFIILIVNYLMKKNVLLKSNALSKYLRKVTISFLYIFYLVMIDLLKIKDYFIIFYHIFYPLG